MIAAWMLYGVTVSLLVAGAAYVVESWAQRRKAQLRWFWAAVFPAAVLLPLLVAVIGTTGDGQTEAWIGEALTVAGGPGGSWSGAAAPGAASELGSLIPRLDPLLLWLWVGASLALLTVGAVGCHRLKRRARAWREEEYGSRRVRISPDVGPAVMGFLACRIVVPEWVLEASDEVRELVIAHEEEHIRARDPQLLLAAFVFLVALPWNLPLWWAAHRLRLAIEIDCDARVLSRGADVRAYGVLLLDVSGHRSIGFAPALANPAEFLERRIRMITRRRRESSWRDPFVALGLASTLLLVACEIDQPPGLTGEEEPTVSGVEPEDGGRVLPPRTVVIPPPPSVVSATPEPEAAPPSPASQNRPALPIISSGDGQPAAELAPPAEPAELDELAREPAFTPMEVRPQLTNRADFIRELERLYPPVLKDAGIGGTVNVWVFIDEGGRVRNARIQESSGYPQLDNTAERLMREVAQFAPAGNRGENVPVWISIPVTFQTRN